MPKQHNTKFDANTYVNDILEGGVLVPCDESAQSFNRLGDFPEFYDEAKFKRGQKFFHENLTSMLFSKFIGLLITLSLPEVYALLLVTDNITKQYTAYKRFLSTVLHVYVWYGQDFYPGSVSWRSIAEVRCRHNGASKQAISAGLKGITQGFMSMGQFGFMGIALVRSDFVGIHNPNKEDLEAYVHFWRCLGYAFGIDDKYNICRDDLDETKEICEVLLHKVFKPEISKMQPDFIKIITTVANGMWCVNPMNSSAHLSFMRHIQAKFILIIIRSLKYTIWRRFFNITQMLSLWIIQTFPLLAYYKFGFSKAYVSISVNRLMRKKWKLFKLS